jgi:4-hydroxybenzoate-CoA ligase
MFELIRKHDPSIFFGVPTLFAAMLNDETFRNEPRTKRLRMCTSAKRCLNLSDKAGSAFGVDILDGVGSTELLHIFLSNAPDDIKYGTSETGAGLHGASCQRCGRGCCGWRSRRDDRQCALGR